MTSLVFIHAFPLDATMYDDIRTIDPDLPLVTPDLPGFGQVPMSSAAPDLDLYAEAVVRDMDAHSLDQAVVGGTSMGGYVAMAIARLYPQRVAGLALVDTKATADSPEAACGRESAAQKLEADRSLASLVHTVSKLLGATTLQQRPDLVRGVENRIKKVNPLAAAWAQRAMASRRDSIDVLRDVVVPALVVVGEEDVLTPPSEAVAMEAALSNCRRVVVEGAGHLTPFEAPEVVARELRQLLELVGD